MTWIYSCPECKKNISVPGRHPKQARWVKHCPVCLVDCRRREQREYHKREREAYQAALPKAYEMWLADGFSEVRVVDGEPILLPRPPTMDSTADLRYDGERKARMYAMRQKHLAERDAAFARAQAERDARRAKRAKKRAMKPMGFIERRAEEIRKEHEERERNQKI